MTTSVGLSKFLGHFSPIKLQISSKQLSTPMCSLGNVHQRTEDFKSQLIPVFVHVLTAPVIDG